MVQEKLRAVFYARVSTEEERQLNALEKQVAECKDAVLQKGWKLVDQYVDEGKSGTQIKRRDEYRRLFEDLENDKFDIVVIKSQDRLQRNTLQEIKGSKVQSIKNEKRGRNCGKSIFSGKIYCAKCGAKYWRSLENGYVKFKCSSYSKYGKIPGKGCDNKSFSENALYSILQSLSEQIVEVNTAEVRKSLLNWLESLRERLRASQGDDTIKEEIRKQTARKEKLTDAYMDGIISKEDYSKRYKELEKTLEDLKDKLLTLEVNEDLQSIEEVIQNIDKEMEEYLQTQSFNESRVEFLNQHLTKVTVNKDSFLLEFDLIGGAILTGKDFYLFVDNPRCDAETEYE